MMKMSDFQKYIGLYGADLSRWPAHEIKPAINLIQNNTEAGKILSSAEKFDQILRHSSPARVNEKHLTGSIMKQVKRMPLYIAPAFSIKPAYFYVPGGGLLVVAILGFMIGFHTTIKESLLLDPIFYTQGQSINDSEEAS